MEAIEFVADTGTAVPLISKGVWTQLVKRDNAFVLEQYSCWGQWCSIDDLVKGQSICGNLHYNSRCNP